MEYATLSPQELWQPLESAISFLAALEGVDNPVLWLERPKGEKSYTLMAKVGTLTKPLDQWLAAPTAAGGSARQWLNNKGVRAAALDEYATSLVEASLERSVWEVSRDMDNGVVRSTARRLPPLLWSYDDDLRHDYWKMICSSDAPGRQQDRWAKQLRDILSAPHSDEKQAQAFSLMRPILERRPDWEYQTHQSWRAWGWADERWQKAMDQWGISTRHQQDGVAFPLWAIQSNWVGGLNAWLKEVGVSAQFVPRHEDIPEQWRLDGNDMTGSLWHWASRMSSAAFISALAENDPSLLNSQDVSSRTALHWACQAGNIAAIKSLMALGVNPCLEDEEKTLASELLGEQFDELFEQLEDYRQSWGKSSSLDP